MDENISYLLWVLGVAREDTRHQIRWIRERGAFKLSSPENGGLIWEGGGLIEDLR